MPPSPKNSGRTLFFINITMNYNAINMELFSLGSLEKLRNSGLVVRNKTTADIMEMLCNSLLFTTG